MRVRVPSSPPVVRFAKGDRVVLVGYQAPFDESPRDRPSACRFLGDAGEILIARPDDGHYLVAFDHHVGAMTVSVDCPPFSLAPEQP